MPTSAALDKVAEKLHLQLYEAPTGWKFFGDLMDAGLLSICGEESFGTGSVTSERRTASGLCWLSVLAAKNLGSVHLISVEEIVHWLEFGRHYYSRYDYEGVDTDQVHALTASLRAKQASFYGKADKYEYADPVDH
jgi:phosphoglucomutase